MPQNVIFPLDCFMPTRWEHKLSRDNEGSTEFIIRGGPLTDPDGVPIEHDGEFTKALVRNLDNFVTKLVTDLVDTASINTSHDDQHFEQKPA
ncbi:hypothetical protein Tdes44962_MAKER07556 [Teratosphaeria destructans]|uniref:Uncharacterized protein n=1 Tax=Teratosphaeria destructans TaxID=418781 RepID=A0A9W7SZ87_9PEZI|nr:hypothetical protein Tdes44962_MAKER07556 [Teratosphaeria destructans]